MRPIGGWLFGRIADKHGRKTDAVIGVYDVFRITGYRLPPVLRNNRYLVRHYCFSLVYFRDYLLAENMAPAPPI